MLAGSSTTHRKARDLSYNYGIKIYYLTYIRKNFQPNLDKMPFLKKKILSKKAIFNHETCIFGSNGPRESCSSRHDASNAIFGMPKIRIFFRPMVKIRKISIFRF